MDLSANAASLHGPSSVPTGFLYLTDGRHGFDIKTVDHREYKVSPPALAREAGRAD
jgi:hypothetical protein